MRFDFEDDSSEEYEKFKEWVGSKPANDEDEMTIKEIIETLEAELKKYQLDFEKSQSCDPDVGREYNASYCMGQIHALDLALASLKAHLNEGESGGMQAEHVGNPISRFKPYYCGGKK